jgi:hypothetical protein
VGGRSGGAARKTGDDSDDRPARAASVDLHVGLAARVCHRLRERAHVRGGVAQPGCGSSGPRRRLRARPVLEASVDPHRLRQRRWRASQLLGAGSERLRGWRRPPDKPRTCACAADRRTGKRGGVDGDKMMSRGLGNGEEGCLEGQRKELFFIKGPGGRDWGGGGTGSESSPGGGRKDAAPSSAVQCFRNTSDPTGPVGPSVALAGDAGGARLGGSRRHPDGLSVSASHRDESVRHVTRIDSSSRSDGPSCPAARPAAAAGRKVESARTSAARTGATTCRRRRVSARAPRGRRAEPAEGRAWR